MSARFVFAVAVVSGLVGGGVALFTVAVAADSTALIAAAGALAVLALMGLVVLGRAVVLEERDRSHGGR